MLVTGDERTALHGAFPAGAGIVHRPVAPDDLPRTWIRRAGSTGGRLRDGAWTAPAQPPTSAIRGCSSACAWPMGGLRRHSLRRQLWDALGRTSPAEAKALAAGSALDVAALARLAPLVHAEATRGDAQASGGASPLRHRPGRSRDGSGAGPSPLQAPAISAQGGAITHLPRFRDLVSDQLDQQPGRWHWSDHGGDACDGALSLARGLIKQR